MKKIMYCLVICVLLVSMVGCSQNTENVENKNEEVVSDKIEKELATSKYVELKGIFVDKSDQEKHPNEALLYVLYTVKSDDRNIKFFTYLANNPGTALTIKINDINEYKDTIYGSLEDNFRDTGYTNLNDGQEVLGGTSLQCIGAFRVAQNDLKPGGIIELTLRGTNQFEEVFEYRTDDVQYFENATELLKNADYETYEKAEKVREEKLAEIDKNLESKIKKVLNETYYTWYISTIQMQIEFYGDEFVVSSSIGASRGGTYEIRNKVLLLHYDEETTKEVEYEFKDGEVNLLSTIE